MTKTKYIRRRIAIQDEDQKDLWPKIRKAFENPKFKWRTIKGILDETGISVGLIEAIIVENEDELIQSRIPSDDGRDLFTTREHYKESNSFLYRFSEQLKY